MLRFLVEHLDCVCIQKWFHPNPNLWQFGAHRHSNCDMYAHTVFKVSICVVLLVPLIISVRNVYVEIFTRRKVSPILPPTLIGENFIMLIFYHVSIEDMATYNALAKILFHQNFLQYKDS